MKWYGIIPFVSITGTTETQEEDYEYRAGLDTSEGEAAVCSGRKSGAESASAGSGG